jgi:two-component SAPR family response regulator
MPNVLFVVKNTPVCKAHIKLLSSKKYTIKVSENYEQALNFLEKNKIDVVIGEIQIEEIEIGEFIKNVT